MEVIYLTESEFKQCDRPQVMAIGFFDGVHLGHQQLFQRAKQHADRLNVDCAALTFSPHPDEVIKGDVNRKYLTPLKEKIAKIRACGVDRLYVMKFDKVFASLSPMDFIHRYIIGMHAIHVVVGFDFTFGFRAKGNVELLKEQSFQGNFGLTVVPKLTYFNEKIGSTETKEMILAGDVANVAHLLGRHYQVKGWVLSRKSSDSYRVKMDVPYMLPDHGVFEVAVDISGETVQGHFTMDGQYGELRLFKIGIVTNQSLWMTFLNKLEVKQAVFV